MTLVAIHQPNFFPWLGYFDKICRSDVFVFLDHVQYSKTGGTWSNRVKMRVGGEARWQTAPIKRAFHGTSDITAIRWDDGQPWRAKLAKSLRTNYAKAPFFTPTMALLEPLIFHENDSLAEFNIHAISAISQYLLISTKHCVRSSDLGVAGHASDLLIGLTKRVGGQAYLCGGGASGYQDDDAFKLADLEIIYQEYVHPVYSQGVGDFQAGLSIIDALMYVGGAETRRLLIKG
jgi:hypothetical protein